MQESVTYRISSTETSWSSLFGLIEDNKDILGIVDYSISQTTLEQVSCQCCIILIIVSVIIIVIVKSVKFLCLSFLCIGISKFCKEAKLTIVTVEEIITIMCYSFDVLISNNTFYNNNNCKPCSNIFDHINNFPPHHD